MFRICFRKKSKKNPGILYFAGTFWRKIFFEKIFYKKNWNSQETLFSKSLWNYNMDILRHDIE